MDIATVLSVGTGVAVLSVSKLLAQIEPYQRTWRRLTAGERRDATVKITWDESALQPYHPQSPQPAA